MKLLRRLHPRIAVLVALVLAGALRIGAWGAAATNDEAGSALVGRSWLAGEHADGAAALYGAYWVDRPPLLPLLFGIADAAGGLDGVRVLGTLAALAVVALAGLMARELAGSTAAAIAALLTAGLISGATLLGDHTYGELVAAPFTVGAVWLLARTHARAHASTQRAGWFVGSAGVLAFAGLMVKQSAIDALVVGFALLMLAAVSAASPLHRRWRALLVVWTTTLTACVAGVAGWAAISDGGIAGAWDAIVGFRVAVLTGSAAADVVGPPNHATHLLVPLVASGLVVALVLAIMGVARTPSGWPRTLLATWLGAALVGVLGGGYYWPHYLLQLAAPAAVGAGVWLAPRTRWLQLAVITLALGAALAGPTLRSSMPHAGRFDEEARDVGRLVAAHADDGDTIEVLFARPGVVYASGLRSTSPYLWSAMQAQRPRVRAGVRARLAAPDAPTWIVRWNDPDAYELDPDGRITQLVEQRYDQVDELHDRTIWRLRDTPAA